MQEYYLVFVPELKHFLFQGKNNLVQLLNLFDLLDHYLSLALKCKLILVEFGMCLIPCVHLLLQDVVILLDCSVFF